MPRMSNSPTHVKPELQVVGINALDSGPGLFFDEPRSLTGQMRKTLETEGRLQPVTLSSLGDKGIESFCWISPCEALAGVPTASCKWQHGAFAYAYSASDRDLDVYFTVSDEYEMEDAGLMLNRMGILSVGSSGRPSPRASQPSPEDRLTPAQSVQAYVLLSKKFQKVMAANDSDDDDAGWSDSDDDN